MTEEDPGRHRLPPRRMELVVGGLWLAGCVFLLTGLGFTLFERVGVVLVLAGLTLCCFIGAAVLQDRHLD